MLVVPVLVKRLQKGDELDFVSTQDGFDLRRLLRVGDKDLVVARGSTLLERFLKQMPAHLENVERLELNILASVLEQIHHHFEILFV